MKRIAILAAMFALFAVGKSYAVMEVHPVYLSSTTDQTVSVSTTTATQVNTSALSGSYRVEVQNIDASNFVVCRIAGTPTLTSGFKLVAGAVRTFDIPDKMGSSTVVIKCLASTAAVNVNVLYLR